MILTKICNLGKALSLTMRELSWLFFFLLRRTFLMATQFPRCRCTARNTTPKAPLPMMSINSFKWRRKMNVKGLMTTREKGCRPNAQAGVELRRGGGYT